LLVNTNGWGSQFLNGQLNAENLGFIYVIIPEAEFVDIMLPLTVSRLFNLRISGYIMTANSTNLKCDRQVPV